MSINWVMLSPSANPPFAPLANEQTLFTSPPRIGLSVSTPTHFPGKQQQQPPYSLTHSAGIVYLTNRRIVYLPDKPTERLKSFAAPILHLHDSHVTAPFFGPNVWTALLQPVQGGGIPTPASTGVVELKLTFKEGGAFDFHTRYERVRERLQHAVEVARMDGDGASSSPSNTRNGVGGSSSSMMMNGVDVSNVNLDELPAYQERSDGPLLAPTVQHQEQAQLRQRQQQQQRDSVTMDGHPSDRAKTSGSAIPPPDEPPPGYEEAQMAELQAEAERRMERDGHGG